MKVFEAPNIPIIGENDKTVFLAGSIEMGAAPKWQDAFLERVSFLSDRWIFLNPRRCDWDSSWDQSLQNPNFYQQVDWELTCLSRANYKIFYFAPGTISPITLLELGKYGTYNTFVVCPEGYARRGNVEMFCYKNEISMYDSLDKVVNELRLEAAL